MKSVSCFLVLNIAVMAAAAQMNIYSALTIPDSLKKDADLVVREEYIKVSVKDKNTAWYDVHQVITVMNEQARKFLFFSQFSDKFHVLDEAEIKVYDLAGNKKNTYSKKEMTSLNYGDGLVPEGKVTYFDITAPSYPITVELNARTVFEKTLAWYYGRAKRSNKKVRIARPLESMNQKSVSSFASPSSPSHCANSEYRRAPEW